jgi:hypothetical protein
MSRSPCAFTCPSDSSNLLIHPPPFEAQHKSLPPLGHKEAQKKQEGFGEDVFEDNLLKEMASNEISSSRSYRRHGVLGPSLCDSCSSFRIVESSESTVAGTSAPSSSVQSQLQDSQADVDPSKSYISICNTPGTSSSDSLVLSLACPGIQGSDEAGQAVFERASGGTSSWRASRSSSSLSDVCFLSDWSRCSSAVTVSAKEHEAHFDAHTKSRQGSIFSSFEKDYICGRLSSRVRSSASLQARINLPVVISESQESLYGVAGKIHSSLEENGKAVLIWDKCRAGSTDHEGIFHGHGHSHETFHDRDGTSCEYDDADGGLSLERMDTQRARYLHNQSAAMQCGRMGPLY